MALYLVVHIPKDGINEEVRAPSRLAELARDASEQAHSPRWLKTWSPDLNDDRIFSLWDAIDAREILATMAEYGFLDDMTAQPLRVREWGPADVIAAEGETTSLHNSG